MSRLRPDVLHLPRAGGAGRVAAPTRAVVVGGGIAGLAAATILSERGATVTLLEKESFLGGRAGSWREPGPDGAPVEIERGFHAFFRQYYNLRALLRRADPALAVLEPLADYPILGPGGTTQSFRDLPTTTPFQIIELARRSPHLRARDLLQVNARAALAMLTYERERTAARWDGSTAAEYLDSLRFPETARRLLFDVFSHSFFVPEAELSAAELLAMFHFYFSGNPEGLVFDVARRPLSTGLWEPVAAAAGFAVRRGVSATRVVRVGRAWRVEGSAGAAEGELVVLALAVPALRALVLASPDLEGLRAPVEKLDVTRPFAVWRLWLDRLVAPERSAFAGTTGVGLLDNISVYDRFQDESIAYARRSGGSVVELHAYAVDPALDERSIKAELLRGLHLLYPETRAARIVHDRFLLRQDCPAFRPGAAGRPGVETGVDGVAMAGDFVALPFPSALMERAAASGFLAANVLLAPLGVAPEPIRTVPRHGLLAPLQWSRRRHA